MSVDGSALRDPRILRLVRLLGLPRHHVLGQMLDVWGLCYDRVSAVVSTLDVDTTAELDGFADALCDPRVDLAEASGDSIRVRGVEKRIRYLLNQRERGRAGGKSSGISRTSKQARSKREANAQADAAQMRKTADLESDVILGIENDSKHIEAVPKPYPNPNPNPRERESTRAPEPEAAEPRTESPPPAPGGWGGPIPESRPPPAIATPILPSQRRPSAEAIGARYRQADELFEHQERLRREVAPQTFRAANKIHSTDMISLLLASGESPDDLRHVLEVYAHEARQRPTDRLRFFNGQTNWQPAQVARAKSAELPGAAQPAPLDYEPAQGAPQPRPEHIGELTPEQEAKMRETENRLARMHAEAAKKRIRGAT